MKLARRAEMMKARAGDIAKIESEEQYDSAVVAIRAIKTFSKEIDAWCDPNIKRWHEGHKMAVQQKRDLQQPLKDAEGLIKRGISKYRAALEKERQEARRRAEEEARAAAEAERQAQAEEMRAAGDDDVAEMIEATPVTPKVVTEVIEEKKDGVSTREHVVVEVIDKKEAIEFIIENWAAFNHLVDINMKELRKLGQAQRENFQLPGCKCTIEQRITVR